MHHCEWRPEAPIPRDDAPRTHDIMAVQRYGCRHLAAMPSIAVAVCRAILPRRHATTTAAPSPPSAHGAEGVEVAVVGAERAEERAPTWSRMGDGTREAESDAVRRAVIARRMRLDSAVASIAPAGMMPPLSRSKARWLLAQGIARTPATTTTASSRATTTALGDDLTTAGAVVEGASLPPAEAPVSALAAPAATTTVVPAEEWPYRMLLQSAPTWRDVLAGLGSMFADGIVPRPATLGLAAKRLLYHTEYRDRLLRWTPVPQHFATWREEVAASLSLDDTGLCPDVEFRTDGAAGDASHDHDCAPAFRDMRLLGLAGGLGMLRGPAAADRAVMLTLLAYRKAGLSCPPLPALSDLLLLPVSPATALLLVARATQEHGVGVNCASSSALLPGESPDTAPREGPSRMSSSAAGGTLLTDDVESQVVVNQSAEALLDGALFGPHLRGQKQLLPSPDVLFHAMLAVTSAPASPPWGQTNLESFFTAAYFRSLRRSEGGVSEDQAGASATAANMSARHAVVAAASAPWRVVLSLYRHLRAVVSVGPSASADTITLAAGVAHSAEPQPVASTLPPDAVRLALDSLRRSYVPNVGAEIGGYHWSHRDPAAMWRVTLQLLGDASQCASRDIHWLRGERACRLIESAVAQMGRCGAWDAGIRLVTKLLTTTTSGHGAGTNAATFRTGGAAALPPSSPSAAAAGALLPFAPCHGLVPTPDTFAAAFAGVLGSLQRILEGAVTAAAVPSVTSLAPPASPQRHRDGLNSSRPVTPAVEVLRAVLLSVDGLLQAFASLYGPHCWRLVSGESFRAISTACRFVMPLTRDGDATELILTARESRHAALTGPCGSDNVDHRGQRPAPTTRLPSGTAADVLPAAAVFVPAGPRGANSVTHQQRMEVQFFVRLLLQRVLRILSVDLFPSLPKQPPPLTSTPSVVVGPPRVGITSTSSPTTTRGSSLDFHHAMAAFDIVYVAHAVGLMRPRDAWALACAAFQVADALDTALTPRAYLKMSGPLLIDPATAAHYATVVAERLTDAAVSVRERMLLSTTTGEPGAAAASPAAPRGARDARHDGTAPPSVDGGECDSKVAAPDDDHMGAAHVVADAEDQRWPSDSRSAAEAEYRRRLAAARATALLIHIRARCLRGHWQAAATLLTRYEALPQDSHVVRLDRARLYLIKGIATAQRRNPDLWVQASLAVSRAMTRWPHMDPAPMCDVVLSSVVSQNNVAAWQLALVTFALGRPLGPAFRAKFAQYLSSLRGGGGGGSGSSWDAHGTETGGGDDAVHRSAAEAREEMDMGHRRRAFSDSEANLIAGSQRFLREAALATLATARQTDDFSRPSPSPMSYPHGHAPQV